MPLVARISKFGCATIIAPRKAISAVRRLASHVIKVKRCDLDTALARNAASQSAHASEGSSGSKPDEASGRTARLLRCPNQTLRKNSEIFSDDSWLMSATVRTAIS
jgi:hypothetical protein